MNPQNQPPANYLDQIAPQQQKRPLFALNLKTISLLAGVVIVLGIIIANIGAMAGSSRLAPWQRLSARLATTQKTADTASPLIKNSGLRSLNSELKIQLANANRDLATPITALKVDPAKLPVSITTAEDGAGMTARLEDARLNAKYDSTYAREMSYQLSTLLTLLSQLYNSGVGPQTQEALKKAYDNVAPIQKNIAEFNASTE